jgi:hypothetical protein
VEPVVGPVEHTTSLAVREKKKLIKSLRRFDLRRRRIWHS